MATDFSNILVLRFSGLSLGIANNTHHASKWSRQTRQEIATFAHTIFIVFKISSEIKCSSDLLVDH